MKKLLFYVIVSLSVVCTLDSCKKEKNPAPKPQSSEISVRQPYSIENPKEGASLEVSTGDKWITGLKANEKEISFSLETNDTGDERTGSIDLSYEGAEPAKITIRQKTPVYQPVDENGTANCYIVSGAGNYKFAAVKGNGSEAVGTVATVEVLWETFGTSATPNKGDLIEEVSYDNAKNAVRFTTADSLELAHLDDGQAGRPGLQQRCGHNAGPQPRCHLRHSRRCGRPRTALPVGQERPVHGGF